MDIKDRFLLFIKYKKLSKREFQKTIGVSNSYIQNITTGIGANVLRRITEIYPELNTTWLLTGEGEMLSPRKEYDNATDIAPAPCSQPVKLYDITASAGFFELYNDDNQRPIDTISVPSSVQADGAIYARGNSMQPVISSGDIIAFKVINDPMYIAWGSIYIIDYSINGDHYTTVKILQPGSTTGTIKLVSTNNDYPPREIPSDNIHLARVVFVVKFMDFV